MRTNIDLDDKLIAKAMSISGINTKKMMINVLLKEYVRKNNQKKILKYRARRVWEGSLAQMRKM